MSNYAICHLSKHATDFTDLEIVTDEFVKRGASIIHVFGHRKRNDSLTAFRRCSPYINWICLYETVLSPLNC